MAHRTFTDRDGLLWEVWDVYPGWGDRRQGADRREAARIATSDRRALLGKRIGVRAELASGWLCFRTGSDKRRLAPVPEGWEGFDDSRLSEMVHALPPTPDQSRNV